MGLFRFLFKEKKNHRGKLQEQNHSTVTANNIVNEKEAREKEIITQEIFEILAKYNDAFPNKRIDGENIFIDQCVNKPGCIGCFWRDNGWFLYTVDDRFNLLANGPFSLNGIIVALLRMMRVPSDMVTREFDDNEYNLYLDGEKPL